MIHLLEIKEYTRFFIFVYKKRYISLKILNSLHFQI